MSHENKTTKRNHFRSSITAKIRAVLVDNKTREHIHRYSDMTGLNEAPLAGDKRVSAVFSSLVSVLQDIDEKLDRIISKMDESGQGKRELDVKDAVDISGSGISLLLSEELEKGQLLKLSIALPGYPLGRFESLGSVVRTVVRNENDGVYYLTGIEFVDLTDDEKEYLVQYTFSQLRKHIRAAGQNEK